MNPLLFAVGCAHATPPAPAAYTRNVAIVVYPDAEPLDWAGPYEVYHDAAMFGASGGKPAFRVYLVSATTDPVDAQGLVVVPQYGVADAPKPDIVVFPGGPSSKITDDPTFFGWATQAANDATIAQSVCTGAFVLAKAGLLEGQAATTHFSSIALLRQAVPTARVVDGVRFVDDGHVVTTAGISAGLDGSLHVVARLLGRRVADQVAAYMEYRWTPEPYLAQGYAYLNPSTDDLGRAMQQADLRFEAKDLQGAEAGYRAILAADPTNAEAWFSVAQVVRDRDPGAAGDALAHAAPGSPMAARWWVEAAGDYAAAGRTDDAVAALGKAAAAGWTDRTALTRDPHLASLATDPRVQKVLAAR